MAIGVYCVYVDNLLWDIRIFVPCSCFDGVWFGQVFQGNNKTEIATPTSSPKNRKEENNQFTRHTNFESRHSYEVILVSGNQVIRLASSWPRGLFKNFWTPCEINSWSTNYDILQIHLCNYVHFLNSYYVLKISVMKNNESRLQNVLLLPF